MSEIGVYQFHFKVWSIVWKQNRLWNRHLADWHGDFVTKSWAATVSLITWGCWLEAKLWDAEKTCGKVWSWKEDENFMRVNLKTVTFEAVSKSQVTWVLPLCRSAYSTLGWSKNVAGTRAWPEVLIRNAAQCQVALNAFFWGRQPKRTSFKNTATECWNTECPAIWTVQMESASAQSGSLSRPWD